MEGTHGELCTRLTNRLCSDHSNSLTHIHPVTTSQVAAVAGIANTVAGFTGNGGAHFDFIDAQSFQTIYPQLIQHGASSQCNLILSTWLDDVLGHNTTQNSITQGFNDIATVNDRRHQQTLIGATIGFGNNQILRNIHQTASQVTGVGRFQGGIGQTLPSTVSGDKVLEYAQTFTEVSGNWRLNNRAVRLGHQATHARQLADLGRGTPGARVSVDVYRVERLLLLFLTLAVYNRLCRESIHHGF